MSLNKLFIANRGEIALRIARTAREIGWHTVGVYAADDEMSPWADQFDALVRLEARGVAAYLDGQALIDIARVQGCSHLHPGYGFLSENAGFAQAVEKPACTLSVPPRRPWRAWATRPAPALWRSRPGCR